MVCGDQGSKRAAADAFGCFLLAFDEVNMRSILSVALLVAALFGIYLTSVYDYLLFHGLAEIFSIVIACGLFMVAWNARRVLHNHYLLFVGIAYLYVGSLDTLHTLAYKGMGVFGGEDANLPTQLWIAARYMEALSLLAATIFFRRRLSPRLVIAAYTLVTGILLAAIFWWGIFPDCFVEGVGLTPFKIHSEYAISLIFLAVIGLLIRNARVFERNVLFLLIASIAAAILGELAFSTYLSVYGEANMIGHLLKVVSFYFIYKAIVQTSLVAPWNLLWRELKQSEEALRELNATLESRVAERTEELEHRAWQLEKLALELSQAEDRERKRLAEILHDDLQQQLAAAKFHVALVGGRMKDDPALQKTIATVDQMLAEAVQTSRTLSHELRPAVLQHGTLGEAIQWLANQTQIKHGLVVRVDVAGRVDSQSDVLKSFLYRAVQELLFNVVKHAGVKEARVRGRRLGRCLALSVSDRGRGFDPQTLRAAKGFGLFSIRERVELMGGRMKIRGVQGRGATFSIVIADSDPSEAKTESSSRGGTAHSA
jgi:signal transduction histidine kinase